MIKSVLETINGSFELCDAPEPPTQLTIVQGEPRTDLKQNDALPAQRMVIFLKAQCHSDESIAEKTGYSVGQVRDILNQTWAKKRLIDEITKNGEDQVSVLVAGTAVDAVVTLRTMMMDPKQAGGVRLACAKELLDRFQGKSPMGDNRGQAKKDRGVPDNITDLDAELARVEEQLSVTIGRKTHLAKQASTN
jgi:hypothetical protein